MRTKSRELRLLGVLGLTLGVSCGGADAIVDNHPTGNAGGSEADAGAPGSGSGGDGAGSGAEGGSAGAPEGGDGGSVNAGTSAGGVGGTSTAGTGGSAGAVSMGGDGGTGVGGSSAGAGGSATGGTTATGGTGGTGGDSGVLSCANSTLSLRTSGGLELEHELGGIDGCGGNAYEDEIHVVFFLFPNPENSEQGLIANFFAPVAPGQTGTFTPSLVAFTGLSGAWGTERIPRSAA